MNSGYKRKIRVGSRDSKLAVTQTKLIMEAIHRAHKEIELELITMKTTGDILLNQSLDKVGGKGLFVKELDQALRDDRIDLSIHSLKDMPMEIPTDLPLIGFSVREDARDALILNKDFDIDNSEGILGTSSKRRMIQLKKMYPKLTYKMIRGNVQTRLKKLAEGYDGTVLALAGIKRLGMESIVSKLLTIEEMIPAAGQGILAIQGRQGENYDFLKEVVDLNSKIISDCERAFVTELNGGCSSPIAGYARIIGQEIELRGLYCREDCCQDSDEFGFFGDVDCDSVRTGVVHGSIENATQLGIKLAKQLKGQEWR